MKSWRRRGGEERFNQVTIREESNEANRVHSDPSLGGERRFRVRIPLAVLSAVGRPEPDGSRLPVCRKHGGGKLQLFHTSACSGRGCHVITTYHYNTCTWDLYGNLLSVAAGAPPAQSPLYTNGTEVVYAVSGSSTTGRDTGGFGFVDTPAAHYSWQTPNGAYEVIPDAPYSVSATLVSDGDLPLNFGPASVVAQVSGTITPSPGKASISSNSCTGSLAPLLTCTVTVTYDPTTIACTPSPYGYAYTGIDLSLSTNSGTNPDFTQKYTVTGVPICDD